MTERKRRGTKLSSLNKTKKEAEKHSKNPLSTGGGFLDFHKIEEGRNEFRIMPPVKGDDLSYYPKRTAWLEVEVPSKEDGEEVEVKRRPIFISTIHGNQKLKDLGKDPIELYIEYIRELAGDIDDKKERQEFLKPVTHWQFGIMPQTVYACYAIKDGKLANLELYESYMKEMQKIISEIEEELGEIDYDIFSDELEGYPLIITKKPNTDEKTKKMKKWVTTVSEGKQKRTETWEDFCKRNAVTETQLKELDKQQSLKERFVDNYTTRDFNMAIDGLKRFDEKNDFNIFENEEFLSQLKEIKALVPEPKQTSTEDVEDTFDLVKEVKKYTKVKLKKFLSNYVAVNYEEQEDEYLEHIRTLDPDTLMEWAILAAKKEDLPELESEEEDDVDVPDDVDVEEENTEEDELPARRRRRS